MTAIRTIWMLYLSGVCVLFFLGFLHSLFDQGRLFLNLWRVRNAWIVLFWPAAPFFHKSRKLIYLFLNIRL